MAGLRISTSKLESSYQQEDLGREPINNENDINDINNINNI